jgi:RND family efflux transporter MFP subunit
MTTESTTARPREGRIGSLPLLLIVAAASAYAGMRWHTTLEQWLVPRAASTSSVAQASPDKITSADGKKQLWTCGMHPQVIQDHLGDCPICHMKLTPLADAGDIPAAGTSGSNNASTVRIDPSVVQNMGVRTVEATQGHLAQSVHVYAMITEAEPGHRDVNLRVSGWIQTLYANTDGMTVKKGDPLFDLYSPELKLAIEELISAKRAAKSVAADADASMRDTGATLVAAAESRLLALDLTPEQIAEFGSMAHAPSVVTFFAPFDGHVTEKAGVYAGSSVTAGQRIFRLAQRTTMWVEGQVPERDLSRVRIGQKARARVDSYPGQEFDGEVVFIHPHFDEMTRTGLVRMVMQNHANALHEGMYATLDIDVGGAEPTVLVPREAVIDSGDSQIVFVSSGKGRFEPRRVVMGQSGDHGLVQVLSGLKPGEQVVASGQFLLDSESRLREAITKFLGQKSAVAVHPMDVTPPTHATVTAQLPADSAVTTSPPQPLIVPGVVLSPERTDAIVNAYLPLAEFLGAVQTENTPLNIDGLAAAIRALRSEVAAPQRQQLIDKASEAAEAMKGQPLEKQRELFKVLSTSLIALVDAMPPSPSVSGTLYVMNCPMAKADWLQRSKEVANPYYAEEMKECGMIVRPLGDGKERP